MWKKSKEVTGLSSSSVVDLNAILAQEKQRARTGEVPQKKNKDPLSKINPGVAQRALADQKAKEVEEKKLEFNEEKLKEKALLYEKYRRGEILSPDDYDDPQYMVDFYVYREEEFKNEENNSNKYEPLYDSNEKHFYHPDIEMEEKRRKWEESVKRSADEERLEREKKEERIRLYNQMKEETKLGREKQKQLQMKRKISKISRKEMILKKAKEKKEKEEQLIKNEEEKTEEAKPSNRLQLKKKKVSD